MDRQAYLAEIDRVNREGTYHPTWESLATHPTPAWYPAEKFGIFIHWGVFSVPAFDNEWYSRNMYIEGSKAYEHHVKTYGPQNQFGYKDFIPMFTMEKWQPEKWAALFREAGAQYVVPVAEHHDGFQLYRSELSHWNAAEMGPKRDLAGEIKHAVEQEGLRYGASSHRVEHWWFMSNGRKFDSDVRDPMALGDFYWPAMPDPADQQDVFGNPAPTDEYMTDWLLRCCEIVDKYHPQILYFDWWIQHNAVKPYLRRFAAYYYNRAEEWGTGCVLNYKLDAFPFGCATPDVERGQFAEAKPYLWQSDTAIARNSWCYTSDNVYKPVREILWDLIDVVSKNGRMLLNVGPKADGTIGEEDTAVLRGIGAWLRRNGEAIYGTQVWRVAQEGPTRTAEGQFTDSTAKSFTQEDMRFTCRGENVYVFLMAPKSRSEARIHSLGDGSVFRGIIRRVELIGHGEVPFTRDADALSVNLPELDESGISVLRVVTD